MRTAILYGLFLCLLGMVVLFGGTRFWAAGPFWLPLLLMLSVMTGLTGWKAYRDRSGLALPPDFPFWGGLCGYVLIRALFFTPVPFETWTELAFLLTAWFLYGVFSDLGSRAHAGAISTTLLLCLVLILCIGAIQQHWNGSAMVLWIPRPAQYGMRASGTFICPNHFAHFLHMGLVTAFAVMLSPRSRISLRIFAGYVALVSTGVLVLTHSRSGLIGAFVGISVVCLGKALRKGWKRVAAVLIGLSFSALAAVFALLRFYPPMRERMVRDIQNNIRISQVWPDTWNMIQGEGFWGAAPGVFANVFDQYREHFSASNLYLEYAHNEFLHTLAEYGWLASAGMLGMLIWMAVRWTVAVVRAPSAQDAMIPLVLLALMLSTLAHAVFDFNLHIPSNGLLFVGLLGVWHGQGLRQGLWKPWVLPPRWTQIYGLSCALICLILIPFVFRMMIGSWHEHQMGIAERNDEMEAVYQRAERLRVWMPWYARGWTQLGQEKRSAAFWMMDETLRKSRVEEARAAYEKALSMNIYDKTALWGLIELARMEKQFEEAYRLMGDLRKLHPFDQSIQIQEGLLLREMGRLEEALKVFEDAAKKQGSGARQIRLNIRSLRRILRERERS
ncbi:MAG: O-antigen ligase family protein [Kiritimatiellia bacterium]